MKNFAISVTITSENDDGLATDASVDVELPRGMSVNGSQLAALTKLIAGAVGDLVSGNYADADVTVCT